MSLIMLLALAGVVGWQMWQREQEKQAAAAAAGRLAELERQALEETRPQLSLPTVRPTDPLGQIAAGTDVGFLVGDLIAESGASAAEAALWGGAGGALLIGPWGGLLAAGIAFQTAHAARMAETKQFREIESMLSNAEWTGWRRRKDNTIAHPLSIDSENTLHTYEKDMVRKYMHQLEENEPGPREFAERVRAWMEWESGSSFANPKTVPMLESIGIVRPPQHELIEAQRAVVTAEREASIAAQRLERTAVELAVEADVLTLPPALRVMYLQAGGPSWGTPEKFMEAVA